MINLRDYILEKFSVAGNESDKILLFDVDDTLLKSEVQVHVVKGGKLLRKLSSSEYNSYKLQPGEDFDYVEFEDPKILNNKSVFLKYWDTLQREYKNGAHIGILTARSNSDMFYDFFKNHGVTIKKELVFAINDPKLGLKGNTIEDRKANAIKRLIDWGYKTIVFFDDNVNNLKSAKKLEDKYDIKVHTVKA
jgi:FMN phosphatase YigB (HAD superfamily)